ncbi:helix-turn-helix domain-containing protein [Enterobacter quasihormaechei]|uniref:helix-turn-helix domain-containing protein n=1 Tax=Enterobacter quasihormaechei TaxID=2529382 RepID=UPI002F42AB32
MRINYILRDIAIWIEENKNINISVYLIARISGFSLWYLQRLFKARSGITLAKYIKLRKMTAAAVSLRISKKSIYNISKDLGYKTQSSFSTAFSRCFGVTPTAFREEEYWSFEKMIHRYDYVQKIKHLQFEVIMDYEYNLIAADKEIVNLSRLLSPEQESRIYINVPKEKKLFFKNMEIEQYYFLGGKERNKTIAMKFLSVQFCEPLGSLKKIQSLMYAGLLPALSITRRVGCDSINIKKNSAGEIIILNYIVPIKNLKPLDISYRRYES